MVPSEDASCEVASIKNGGSQRPPKTLRVEDVRLVVLHHHLDVIFLDVAHNRATTMTQTCIHGTLLKVGVPSPSLTGIPLRIARADTLERTSVFGTETAT